jgi:hypothetical protein
VTYHLYLFASLPSSRAVPWRGWLCDVENLSRDLPGCGRNYADESFSRELASKFSALAGAISVALGETETRRICFLP